MASADMNADINIHHLYGGSPDPLRIKLEKNTKGYQWEISVSGSSIVEIMCKIREADTALKAEYGAQ